MEKPLLSLEGETPAGDRAAGADFWRDFKGGRINVYQIYLSLMIIQKRLEDRKIFPLNQFVPVAIPKGIFEYCFWRLCKDILFASLISVVNIHNNYD